MALALELPSVFRALQVRLEAHVGWKEALLAWAGRAGTVPSRDSSKRVPWKLGTAEATFSRVAQLGLRFPRRSPGGTAVEGGASVQDRAPTAHRGSQAMSLGTVAYHWWPDHTVVCP